MDRDSVARPQRRTALVAKELSRYNIDIAALSETRLADEGSLTEQNCGYTFFWKGKAENEDRIHGVGLAVKTSLMKQLPDLPTGVNERLMKLRLPLSHKRCATIISAYAPTLTSSEETIEQFYTDLSYILNHVPAGDKIILLGDFNARVGQDYERWDGVLGRHGVGKMNNNGLLLLSKCAEYDLVITNTVFRMADKYKTTWMHPRSKQWHLIDFVIVRQRDIQDVLVTRAMRGAECWTDHRLVRCNLKMHIAPRHLKRPKLVRAPFNIARLQQPFYLQKFQNSLDEKLAAKGPLTGDTDQKWKQFKEVVIETAKSALGLKRRKHQDWFNENDKEIEDLLARKNKAFMEWQNDPNSTPKKDRFKSLQASAQKEIRKMHDQWWERKAEEIQGFAASNNSKQFFSSLKTVYGPSKSGSAPLLSADRATLIKDKAAINIRWKEHFSQLLNHPSSVEQSALEQVPQQAVIVELDNPPSMDELKKAIKLMSCGKASGKDGIPAEVYKALSDEALQAFHSILSSIWEEEVMPADLRDATIVALYKNKGSRSDCGSYRGISLLSIAGKILARIILNRLISSVAEKNLPESQCGFRLNRSTVDMVFTVRQVQEKCLEQNMNLYSVFIDLTKAFDTVNREALWTILRKLGCPAKFTTLIRLFHDDMTGEVLSDGESSESFSISNGVKQGCVLAPVLFNLFFTQVLHHAVRDLDLGVYIRYRLDGSLFDLRRLTAKTKTMERLILEALFADDCALMAHQETHLQTIVDKFSEASKMFGLTISLGKTEVLLQPAPDSNPPPPCITIDGTQLKNVDTFKYLGSTISSDCTLDSEIAARIKKASQALGKLRTKVLQHKDIRLSTKLKVYNAVVLPSLLYGCEAWTLYRRHIKKLEQFHTRSLRSIMCIRWQDRITNQEVLDRAATTCIEAKILQAQLRWCGHVIRMEESRIPRQLFYGELASGSRKRGRPKKRFKDNLKANIKWTGIQPRQLETAASDRSRWRALTTNAVKAFEDDRRQRLAAARDRRHKAATASVLSTGVPCPICSRTCASDFGLRSHMRIHK